MFNFPKPLSVITESIPESLKSKNRWILWRYHRAKGANSTQKWKKLPYAVNGELASASNPGTWTSFDMAHQAYKTGKFSGLGFVLGEGVHGIDLDDCIDLATGEFNENAKMALESVQGYAEISPSGTGLKIYALTNLSRSQTQIANGWEMYLDKRYFCVTGHVIPSHTEISTDIQDVSGLLTYLSKTNAVLEPINHDPFSSMKSASMRLSLDRIEKEILPHFNGDHYDDWIRMGMAIHDATDGSPEGEELWDNWSINFDNYEPGACAEKWKGFGKSSGGHLITMGSFIAELKSRFGSLSSNTSQPLQVLSIEELRSLPSQQWLIKGIIPKTGMGVIFGDSGAGKTFITLDLALSVARRISWHGRRVKDPVGVLYVSAEGGSAMNSRINAYSTYHGVTLEDAPFGIVISSVNLRGGEANKVIEACHEMGSRGHPVGLIIFDTLNRTIGGGDENSSKDMGEYLDAVSRISKETASFILIVHHSGKDTQKGARGHSSLRAAADAEFEVKIDGDQQVLKVTKSRDGETGIEYVYKREVVMLGLDEDLEPIESCVAIPGDRSALRSNKPKPRGEWQQLAYEVAESLGEAASERAVVDGIGQKTSHQTRWRERAKRGIQGCIESGALILMEGRLIPA